MPKPKKGPRFGGSPSHHKHIVSNLATELFRHGRVETTWAKAKNVQPLADRMVTFAKRGDLHARRQVLKVITDRDVAHKLFEDVGPAFAERNGGYTRVLKTGTRKGDGARLALLELVEAGAGEKDSASLTEAPRRRWSLRRRRGTVSKSAREREEELAAAEDRGEEPAADLAEPEPGGEPGEEDPTGLDPAEVEQRLAAAEEAEEAEGEADAGQGESGESGSSEDDEDGGAGDEKS
jgi:large subunit ribosomal protein L17